MIYEVLMILASANKKCLKANLNLSYNKWTWFHSKPSPPICIILFGFLHDAIYRFWKNFEPL